MGITKLSILIPSISSRRFMFNTLYQEFNRQIDSGGYRSKGFEKWLEDVPRLDKDGNQVLSEFGSPIVDSIEREKKLPHIVEVIHDLSDTDTIGTKRNRLLSKANGDYVCFFDDDDWPSSDYIKTLMEGIEQEPDCLSLRGEMTTEGINPELFEHSIKYKTWETAKTGPIKYLRYPNHLNAIRSDIAKQFKFPEKNFGEDHAWSTTVHHSGLLKTEYYIDKVIYNYRFNPKKLVA